MKEIVRGPDAHVRDRNREDLDLSRRRGVNQTIVQRKKTTEVKTNVRRADRGREIPK